MRNGKTLQADGHSVAIAEEPCGSDDVPCYVGNPSELAVLSESEVGDASAVIVASQTGRRNLLIAQLVRAHFDVQRIIVLVDDPDRLNLFAEAGHEPQHPRGVFSGRSGSRPSPRWLWWR